MTTTPPAYVVDASTAVKWVIPEDFSDQADALLATSLQMARPIVVPAHFLSEVTNAIYQRVRSTRKERQISEERAQTALAEFVAVPVLLQSSAALYERAFAFARRLGLEATYDSLYVVLAEMVGGELWTADRRLLNALGTQAPWVRWLGDYPLP